MKKLRSKDVLLKTFILVATYTPVFLQVLWQFNYILTVKRREKTRGCRGRLCLTTFVECRL